MVIAHCTFLSVQPQLNINCVCSAHGYNDAIYTHKRKRETMMKMEGELRKGSDVRKNYCCLYSCCMKTRTLNFHPSSIPTLPFLSYQYVWRSFFVPRVCEIKLFSLVYRQTVSFFFLFL